MTTKSIICKLPLSEYGVAETTSLRFHGWAAARGNLKDEENRREYVHLKATSLCVTDTL